VPQLKTLLTDPAMTAIPHFQAFLNIANHPQSWTTPMISVYGELRDGVTNALDAVVTGGADPKQQLDDLAATIQAKLDANGG
jgi:maltose-binding protein MalE